MVVAPLEHTDLRSSPDPTYVLEEEKVKAGADDTQRCSPEPATFLYSDNNTFTCSGPPADHRQNITGDAADHGGQAWHLPGASASQSLNAVATSSAAGEVSPGGGLKRRRESSDSSSSDEGCGVVAAKYHRKRRFFSHREYKGRKGSPPLMERRVRCRRRSGSCSSSPDTRQGWSHVFHIFSVLRQCFLIY